MKHGFTKSARVFALGCFIKQQRQQQQNKFKLLTMNCPRTQLQRNDPAARATFFSSIFLTNPTCGTFHGHSIVYNHSVFVLCILLAVWTRWPVAGLFVCSPLGEAGSIWCKQASPLTSRTSLTRLLAVKAIQLHWRNVGVPLADKGLYAIGLSERKKKNKMNLTNGKFKLPWRAY